MCGSIGLGSTGVLRIPTEAFSEERKGDGGSKEHGRPWEVSWQESKWMGSGPEEFFLKQFKSLLESLTKREGDPI